MKIKKLIRLETCCFFKAVVQFGILVLTTTPSTAQIIPDNSLPVNSTVITEGNKLIINGGTASGSNLFHSFSAFSVLTGQAALFNNGLNIENIFSRITGNSISHINGVLAANGTANLFFLNPNGIIFGSNASLAIGGSFLGSTANQVLFDDGSQFSTEKPKTPLLTISNPVGLELNKNQGEIIVQGGGHQLRFAIETSTDKMNFINSPILGGGESQWGLRTAPGKTLGLIGGKIIIDGGILTAFSGEIELAAVNEGVVTFSPMFNFSYEDISQFQDIFLDKRALLDASGISYSEINLHAKNVTIQNGATIFISNLSNGRANSINITATDHLNLKGITDFSQFSQELKNNRHIAIQGVTSQTLSSARGASINIHSKHLSLENFTNLNSLSFGEGEGGAINLQVQENLKIDGNNPLSSFFPSSIASLTMQGGKAGDILVTGKILEIENGGILLSQSLGTGNGGNIKIDISKLVKVSGAIPINPAQTEFSPSLMGTASFLSGNAGELIISTENLIVDSGGLISNNTNGTGNSGNILIDADSVQIMGAFPNLSHQFKRASQISSSADKPLPFFLEFFNLPPFPSGNAGSVEINTKHLTISNGGLINVTNEGIGNGGNINISAEKTVLDQGSISAETLSGRGGNISIQGDSLFLQNNSQITSSAENQGNGGNINLNTDLLLVFENSQITANAFQGNGGNIEINGNVLIGSESIISASSELGIDGLVQINGDVYEINDLTSKPAQFSEEQLIAQGCFDGQNESAIQIIQRGIGGRSLTGKVSYSFIPFSDPEMAAIAKKTASNPIVDAKRMVVIDGTVHLLAEQKAVEECR